VEQEKFVVIDFIIRVKEFPKGVDKLAFRPIAERATKRMKKKMVVALDDARGRVTAEHLGRTDKVNKRITEMGSIVIRKPTMKDVMRVEDVLRRAEVDKGKSVVLKMRDANSNKYLEVEVGDFRMSGPKGGAWKPFTEWYKGTKELGLPQ